MSKSKEILNKINNENIAKYGDIKECCGLFESMCRCSSLNKLNFKPLKKIIKSDKYFIENLKEIVINGYLDENPRPRYKDNTIAYSKYITQVFEKYDLNKSEFPITTLRNTAVKMGIKEIMTIYISQKNTKKSFHENNVFWWDDWMNSDGNIGRSYSYNLESHRENEMTKEKIEITPIIIDKKYSKLSELPDDKIYKRIIENIGYFDDYKSVNNFNDEEVSILRSIWVEMFYNCYNENGKYYNIAFVHKNWHSFKNFLIDVRYLPQYFLAREKDFKNWNLNIDYYNSNCYSKETSVFLKNSESKLYYRNDNKRFELSRNQINSLLYNLKNKPFDRRHIISLWNWANIDKKELVECAYETIFTVRKKDNDLYLDMTLIQRSSDYITANYINKIQYVALQMMISKHLNYKLGYFSHFVQNLHIYDRHIEAANEIINKQPLEKQPILKLKENKDFYNYTIDDFILENIEGITKIKSEIEIAV